MLGGRHPAKGVVHLLELLYLWLQLAPAMPGHLAVWCSAVLSRATAWAVQQLAEANVVGSLHSCGSATFSYFSGPCLDILTFGAVYHLRPWPAVCWQLGWCCFLDAQACKRECGRGGGCRIEGQRTCAWCAFLARLLGRAAPCLQFISCYIRQTMRQQVLWSRVWQGQCHRGGICMAAVSQARCIAGRQMGHCSFEAIAWVTLKQACLVTYHLVVSARNCIDFSAIAN